MIESEVAKVLAAHEGWDFEFDRQKCACGADIGVWDHPHGGYSAAHRAHVAAEVTNAVVTALGRPEVEGQVARAIKAVDDSGLPAIWARQYARAALAAIPEALGAGEVDRG